MEGNKEDALKCIKIARQALAGGYKEKAVRFANKSLKLYPTVEAQEFLDTLTSNTTASPNQRRHNQTNGTSRGYGTFSSSNGATRQSDEEDPKETYTTEQSESVRRVNKSKDYYEVLGVSKEATDSDLKKAYRKLALQLHPDKNKAPGATDAFKAVGKAFGVLSDQDKRQQYDLYGPEEESRTRSRHRFNNMDGYQDIDPDEIFNMFFGGGFPSGNVRVFRRGNNYYSYNNTNHRRQHQQHEGNGNQNVAAWIQFMPLVLLLVLTVFSNFILSDNPYSFHHHGDYAYLRTTSKLGVNYYVKRSFDGDYKGADLRRLERRIEDEYVEYLRGSCYQERVTKENLRRKGVYFSNKDFIKRAENMKTPSCEDLEKIFARAG